MSFTDKYELLKDIFGHDSFRGKQEAVVDRIISGGDVLSVMPTGAGKSLCYQLSALMMNGIALVVSPLISLMKDQASALYQMGVKAALLNSSLSAYDYNITLQLAKDGEYKVIFVAPERLEAESFISFAKNADISMVTVDEAHCVSQWGQDFRPSYLRIADFIELLQKRPVISAFTATATEAVKLDIIKKLKLVNPLVIQAGFDRPNLYFEVRSVQSAEKNEVLAELLCRYNEKSGIVYCMTRKLTESVYHFLSSNGLSATLYHAGLSDEERNMNQDDFIYDRKNVIVATNAFGMGIDKSNVAYVIHYNMPRSIEAYYQEAGRAGRDGEKAECILLYTPSDIHTHIFLIDRMSGDSLSERELRIVQQNEKKRLKAMTDYCSSADCLRRYILGYFGEKALRSCNNCSVCIGSCDALNITTDAQKIISCVYRLEKRGLYMPVEAVRDILKGEEKLCENGLELETLSTFGIMSECSTEYIGGTLDFLVREGYLQLTQSDCPCAEITEKGDSFIRGKLPLYMKAPNKKKISNKTKIGETLSDDEAKLFQRLRELRLRLANSQRVPAYVVLTDSSLYEIARKKPKSEKEMREIQGVGIAKLRSYGKTFIDEIIKFGKGE